MVVHIVRRAARTFNLYKGRCYASVSLRLPPLPTTGDLLRLYRLRARKQLSQNFLLEMRLTDKIVKAAGQIEDGDVCEVGPGPGSITRSILRRNPRRVLVIEKDNRFLPFLDLLKDSAQERLHVILGDVLRFDMSRMFRDELRVPWEDKCPNIHLIGNLPFSVSTPLIIHWLHDISLKQNAWEYGRVRMTLTFQKEVAERIVAEANAGQRCRLSVMCQNWCDVKYPFTIRGASFVPPPDVDVGVVTLRPKKEPVIKEDFHMVEKVVRQMFCYRQKACLKSAETLFPKPVCKEKSTEMMALADVNPEMKPYQISLEEFDRIVKAYKYICNKKPSYFKYNPREQAKIDKEFWRSIEDTDHSDADAENDWEPKLTTLFQQRENDDEDKVRL